MEKRSKGTLFYTRPGSRWIEGCSHLLPYSRQASAAHAHSTSADLQLLMLNIGRNRMTRYLSRLESALDVKVLTCNCRRWLLVLCRVDCGHGGDLNIGALGGEAMCRAALAGGQAKAVPDQRKAAAQRHTSAKPPSTRHNAQRHRTPEATPEQRSIC